MYKYSVYISLCFLLFISCKEESALPSPLSNGGEQPGKVTDIRVENRPGGAMLSYNIPGNEDLLYVKAVYEYPAGNIREVKASMYVDTLVIEGVGDTTARTVELFAVSRSEKVSEPTQVTIQPLTPPVHSVGSSLMVSSDFGGVAIAYQNELSKDIVIEVLKKVDGFWTHLESHYTNNKSGIFAVRGQDAVQAEFGLYVRDRWRNKSDTMVIDLTPLYEVELAAPAPITSLPGDYNLHYNNLHYGYMFDGIRTSANYAGTLATATAVLPLSFTLDFKKPTKFSRFKYWMRLDDTYGLYNYCSPEEWEIWGSNELTDDWSKWTKIMDCTAVKPSGSPAGVLTAQDREAAANGLNFTFPIDTPPYRYIRWKTNKTFGALNAVQISELAFFGNDKNEGK